MAKYSIIKREIEVVDVFGRAAITDHTDLELGPGN